MKRVLFLLLASGSLQQALAQVSISNPPAAADPSAMLEIKSTNRGLLLPRLTNRTDVAAPATGLMVYETASNAVWIYNGTAWTLLGGSGGGGQWLTSGTHIYNSNTGNIGVGLNTNINKKFTVKGDGLFVYQDGTNNATLSLMANSTAFARLNFIKPDSTFFGSVYTWGFTNNLYLQQGTNTNQLVLNDNGFVGIRTSSPTKPLDVAGSIRSRDSVTADKDVIAGDDVVAGDAITAGGTVAGQAFSGGSMVLSGSATVAGEVTSFTGLTINNAAATLELKSGNDSKGFVQLAGDDVRVGTYGANTNGKVIIRTGGDDQVYVDNSGKMGFDIPAPLSRIHISSGSDAGLASHGYLMMGSVSGLNLILDNNEIMVRENGAASHLVLQNDGGTVRIGNVAVPAGYKFAVNGKMLCEELRVKLAASWPDYVFRKNYQLMPLPQLQSFIAANNHLPNIPSAAEVEKQGIAVGEMNRKLLEKVEELTLYILQLEKRLSELEAKTHNPAKQ